VTARKIIQYPQDEVALRRKSPPVRAFNRQVKKLIKDLKDTLGKHKEGVGLAAVQINVHSRVFIVRLGAKIDGDNEDAGPPIAMVNAEIIEAKNEKKGYDGCLSFPGLFGDTIRPNYVRVKGLDEWGKPFDKVFEEFDAVVIHHEIDHTDGVLFIDRVSGVKDLYTVKEEDGKLIRQPVLIRR
jgi:peptide deformylase